MFPLILIVIGIALLAGFKSYLKKNPELEKIQDDNIYESYLQEYQKDIHIPILKGQITKSINIIIKHYGNFKVGKTGDPISRNKAHKHYDEMFLLCASKHDKVIEELESYYNEKYIQHTKNDNKKVGSAGKCQAVNGKYYLYIVVNKKIKNTKKLKTK